MPKRLQTSLTQRLTVAARDFLADKPALRVFVRDVRTWLWSRRSRRIAREDRGSFSPRVTAIVPNFNHARYLPKRLDSILQQTYGAVEILILDDASTDDSANVIRRYRDAHPDRIRVRLSEANSGNPFRQWQKGIAEATGDLIWICESDDFADTEFLDRLVSAFLDESVMIAFGCIQFADEGGRPYPGLDQYRERAQPGIWSAKNVRPAKAWFDTAFGVSNVIANVGGCLIRNQPIEPEIWETAATYRVLGDWYLYAMLSRGGQIAYVPSAVSWFRQHRGNTSVSAFGSAQYYREHERLVRLVRQRWGIPDATVARFEANLAAQFDYAKAAEDLGALSGYFDLGSVLAEDRRARHVLIVFLGFFLGGGELFPIHLANELVKKGLMVSV
ncbi:MAG TPA: glycosyltransferase, partial [Rhodopila sp.]|nr:glycosyltransferase [Rhodopila sp.]